VAARRSQLSLQKIMCRTIWWIELRGLVTPGAEGGCHEGWSGVRPSRDLDQEAAQTPSVQAAVHHFWMSSRSVGMGCSVALRPQRTGTSLRGSDTKNASRHGHPVSRRYTRRMPSQPATVKEYLASLPDDRRAAVEAIRRVILDNLDGDYEEGMQYGM